MARIQPGSGNILLEGIIEPVSDTDAANKAYVDNNAELDINGQTEETAIANNDELPFYDTSATANRKIEFSDFANVLKDRFDSDYQGHLPNAEAIKSTLPAGTYTTGSISRLTSGVVTTGVEGNSGAAWGFFDAVSFGSYPEASETFSNEAYSAWTDFFVGANRYLALDFNQAIGTDAGFAIGNGVTSSGDRIQIIAQSSSGSAAWYLGSGNFIENNAVYTGRNIDGPHAVTGTPGTGAINWTLGVSSTGGYLDLLDEHSTDRVLLGDITFGQVDTAAIADDAIERVNLGSDLTIPQLGLSQGTDGGLRLSPSFVESASTLAINMAYEISTTKTDFESTFTNGRMFFSTADHSASITLDALFGTGATRSNVPTNWSDITSIVITPDSQDSPTRSVASSTLYNAIGQGVILEVRNSDDSRIGIWSIVGRTRIGGVATNPIVFQVSEIVQDSGSNDAYGNSIYTGLRKALSTPLQTATTDYTVVVHGIDSAKDGRYLLNGSTGFEKLQVFNGFIDPTVAANVTEYSGHAYRLTENADGHLTGELVSAPVLDLPEIILGDLDSFGGFSVEDLSFTSTVNVVIPPTSGQWGFTASTGAAITQWTDIQNSNVHGDLLINLGNTTAPGVIAGYFQQPTTSSSIKEVAIVQSDGAFAVLRANNAAALTSLINSGVSGTGTMGVYLFLQNFTIVEQSGAPNLTSADIDQAFYFSCTTTGVNAPQPATLLALNANSVYRGDGTFGSVPAGAISNETVTYSKFQNVAGHNLIGNPSTTEGSITDIFPGPEFEFVSDTATPVHTSLRLSRAIYPLATTPSATGTGATGPNNSIRASGTPSTGARASFSTSGAYLYTQNNGTTITTPPSTWSAFEGSSPTIVHIGLGTSFNGDELIGWLNLTSEPAGDRIISARADANNWAVFQVLDSNRWQRFTSGTNTINVSSAMNGQASGIVLIASQGTPQNSMAWLIGYRASTNTAVDIVTIPGSSAREEYEAQVDAGGNIHWAEKRVFDNDTIGAVPRPGDTTVPNFAQIQVGTFAHTLPLSYDNTGLNNGRGWSIFHGGSEVAPTFGSTSWEDMLISTTNSLSDDEIRLDDQGISSTVITALETNNADTRETTFVMFCDHNNWAVVTFNQSGNNTSVYGRDTGTGGLHLGSERFGGNNEVVLVAYQGNPQPNVTFYFPFNASSGVAASNLTVDASHDNEFLSADGSFRHVHTFTFTEPDQTFALWKGGTVESAGIDYNSDNLPVRVRKTVNYGEIDYEITADIRYNANNLPDRVRLFHGHYSTTATLPTGTNFILATKTITYDASNLPSGTTVT